MNSLQGMKYEMKEVKKLFTKEYIALYKECYYQDRSYQQMMHEAYKEPKPSKFKTLDFLKSLTEHYISSVTCIAKGHDMECTSSAGPESGQESGYCKRCGYSFHVIMY